MLLFNGSIWLFNWYSSSSKSEVEYYCIEYYFLFRVECNITRLIFSLNKYPRSGITKKSDAFILSIFDFWMYSADDKFDGTWLVNVVIKDTGDVLYLPPAMLKSVIIEKLIIALFIKKSHTANTKIMKFFIYSERYMSNKYNMVSVRRTNMPSQIW